LQRPHPTSTRDHPPRRHRLRTPAPRLRPPPQPAFAHNRAVDPERGVAFRRVHDADHRAQVQRRRIGGAASRIELTLNTYTNFNFNAQQRRHLMRANQAFPSKYLKSSDMKEKPRVAVISHLAQETVGQGQDAKEKHVLHFEDQKPLVLNRTNWDTLEEAFGDSDDWPGQKVKIRCARTQYQGKATDGIRLEAIVPKPALKDDLNDEITI